MFTYVIITDGVSYGCSSEKMFCLLSVSQGKGEFYKQINNIKISDTYKCEEAIF